MTLTEPEVDRQPLPPQAPRPPAGARPVEGRPPATAEPGSYGLVLVVDDVPDNLAVLHDALDESGYTVLVANSGEAALQRAAQARPDIVLLDACMPGMDGFEVARRLKADPATAGIPIVFMTGLTGTEHLVEAFAAGGVDYVTKPIRPREVLARMAAHLASAQVQRQARNALDAFGHATMAVDEARGRCVWQTALARRLMAEFYPEDSAAGDALPPEVQAWVAREALRRRAGAEPAALAVRRGPRRLHLVLHAVDPDALGAGHWLLVLRVADDSTAVEALVHGLDLTAREAEVMLWVARGKTNRDIAEICGMKPRTVTKHLEHIFEKLGVETRSAAAVLASAGL